MKTFTSSGKIGDLLYQLCVLKHYGPCNLYLNTINPPIYLKNSVNYDFVAPLIENQYYINQFKIWEKEPCWACLDDFRINYNLKDNLFKRICDKFAVPIPKEPWINANLTKIAPIVINRTFRYRNVTPDIKKYLNNAIFIGHKDEYDDFVYNIGKVSYYECNDMMEMASVINGCELFIGNQSCCLALAISLFKPILQEVPPNIDAINLHLE